MTNIRNMLIAAIAIASLATSASAGSFAMGVTGSMMDLDASGTETDRLTAAGANVADTSTRNKSISESSGTASIYVEYIMDTRFPITLGGEYTPGTVDIGSKFSRTDTELSQTATGITTATSVTRTASASASNFATIYTELGLFGPFYVRAGASNITVSSSNQSNMDANTNLSGLNIGAGFKGTAGNGVMWKLAYEETDYDTLSVRSTNNSVAVETSGVKADLDTKAYRISLGKSF